MTNQEFQRLCDECFNELKNTTPIDTGNLRYNATLMEYKNGGKVCEIYVDGDGEVLYAVYQRAVDKSEMEREKKPERGLVAKQSLKSGIRAYPNTIKKCDS